MKTKLMTRLICFLMFATVLFGCLTACKNESGIPTVANNSNGENNVNQLGSVFNQDGSTANQNGSMEFASATMCTAPSTEKIVRMEDYSSGTHTLSFQGFRNEYENAQVILKAKSDVFSYDVELSDLTSGENTLSKDCFAVYNQKYILVSEIFEFLSGNTKGAYPDALLPFDVAVEYGENYVRRGQNQGIWFTVNISEDQPAGVYTGKFALTVNGETKEFPVEVTVWDYAIPSATHQKSCFAVYIDALARGEVAWTMEMEELYTEYLLEYRLQPQSLPVGLGHTFNPSKADLVNWVNSVVKYAEDDRVTWVNIPYKKLDKVWTLPDGTEGQAGTLIDFKLYEETLVMLLKRSVKEKINLMTKMGMYLTCVDEADYNQRTKESAYLTMMLKKTQQNLFDEYSAAIESGEINDRNSDYWLGAKVEEDFMREVLEDMRTIQYWTTSAHTNTSNNPDLIYDYPATQCLYLWHFNNQDSRDAFQDEIDRYNDFYNTDNGEIWTYTAVTNASPYPTLHIDDDSLTLRAMGWMFKQYKISGHEYWYTNLYYQMANGWDGKMSELQDCYTVPNRYPVKNGDGFIFYPGAPYGIKGPVGSIRLEVLRDSMEDYEVFYMMEQMYKDIAAKNDVEYSFDEFVSMIEFLSVGYYSGTMVQIGDTLTENFSNLRQAMVSALDLLSMGVRVTDFEKNGSVITLTMDAPAGVTVSVNGQTLSKTEGKLVATIDLSKTNIATVSATNETKTVSGDYWLGMSYEAIAPNQLSNYISSTGATTQFVENDSVCGKDAFRLNIQSGRREVIINLKDAEIDNISQSLWLDIYNDTDKTIEIAVEMKKMGASTYSKVYKEYYVRKTMTITLEPGMNHVEINGYALLCGERTPTKAPVATESVKLIFNNNTQTKLAITDMYIEKG